MIEKGEQRNGQQWQIGDSPEKQIRIKPYQPPKINSSREQPSQQALKPSLKPTSFISQKIGQRVILQQRHIVQSKNPFPQNEEQVQIINCHKQNVVNSLQKCLSDPEFPSQSILVETENDIQQITEKQDILRLRNDNTAIRINQQKQINQLMNSSRNRDTNLIAVGTTMAFNYTNQGFQYQRSVESLLNNRYGKTLDQQMEASKSVQNFSPSKLIKGANRAASSQRVRNLQNIRKDSYSVNSQRESSCETLQTKFFKLPPPKNQFASKVHQHEQFSSLEKDGEDVNTSSFINENICDTTNMNKGPYIKESQTMQDKVRNKTQRTMSLQQRSSDSKFKQAIKEQLQSHLIELKESGQFGRNSEDHFSNVLIKALSRYDESADAGASMFTENVKFRQGVENRLNKKNLLKEILSDQDDLQNEVDDDCLPDGHTLKSNTNPKINLLLEMNLRLANLKEIQDNMFTQNMFIRSIDLRNNRIMRIPEKMCELPNLWKVRLDYNYLTELPLKIGFLPKLEFLSASQNRLQSLPPSMFFLGHKLQFLLLNDNKFKEIQYEFGQLKGLKTLLLHNNFIAQLPTSMYQMKELQEFGIDWFIYMEDSLTHSKIQKDEIGLINIKNLLQFFKIFDNISVEHTPNSKKTFVNFIHFIMYFHNLKSAYDIQNITFKPKKRSIIHQMALQGHLYLFHELITQCPQLDFNKTDEEESTCLILAIKNKRKDFIKYLMGMNMINVNKVSSKYGHPLHLSLQTHELKLALKLLKNEKNDCLKNIDVTFRNDDGNNALHFLFMNFYINPAISKSITKKLIKKGVNVNQKNKNDMSPLHIALDCNQYDALAFSLEHNKKLRHDLLQGKLASFPDFSKCMFDFNLKGGKLQKTPLHYAVASNNIKIILMLLTSEEIFDYMSLDEDGRQAKDVCPYNSPIYKLLIQYERKIQLMVYNQYQRLSNPEIDFNEFQLRFKYNTQQRLINQQKGNQFPFLSKGKTKRPHTRQKSENDVQVLVVDDSITIMDEFSNGEAKTPFTLGYQSGKFSVQSNVVRSFQGSKNTPFSYRDQEDATPKILRETNFINNQYLQIKSQISTPDESMITNFRNYRKGTENNQISVSHQGIFPYKTDFNNHNNQALNRVYASKERILSLNKNESVLKEKFEEEEDGNIPEDDKDHINPNQLERPNSPMRFSYRSATRTQDILDESIDMEQKRKVSNIINEINKSKYFKNNNLNQSKDGRVGNQAALDSFYRLPTISTQLLMNTGYNHNGMTMDNNQEQGNAMLEEQKEYKCYVQDDSIQIQISIDDKRSSPKFAKSIQKFSDLKTRLDDEIMVEYHSKKTEQEFQQYQKLFCKIVRNEPFFSEESFNGFKINQNSGMINFLVDFAFYISKHASINQIKTLIQLAIETQQNVNLQISKRVRDYIIFELINNHQIKVSEQQVKLKRQLQLLDQQTLNTQSQPLHEVLGKNHKFQQSTHLQQLRVQMRKSPSQKLLKKDLSESPKKEMIQTLGDSTPAFSMSIISQESPNEIRKISQSVKNFPSDLKQSPQKRKAELFQKPQQPLSNKAIIKLDSVQRFENDFDKVIKQRAVSSQKHPEKQTSETMKKQSKEISQSRSNLNSNGDKSSLIQQLNEEANSIKLRYSAKKPSIQSAKGTIIQKSQTIHQSLKKSSIRYNDCENNNDDQKSRNVVASGTAGHQFKTEDTKQIGFQKRNGLQQEIQFVNSKRDGRLTIVDDIGHKDVGKLQLSTPSSIKSHIMKSKTSLPLNKNILKETHDKKMQYLQSSGIKLKNAFQSDLKNKDQRDSNQFQNTKATQKPAAAVFTYNSKPLNKHKVPIDTGYSSSNFTSSKLQSPLSKVVIHTENSGQKSVKVAQLRKNSVQTEQKQIVFKSIEGKEFSKFVLTKNMSQKKLQKDQNL